MKDIMLLFDLDGTLWDSGREIALAWNMAINKVIPGYKTLTTEDIHSIMGKTMDEIVMIFFPDLPEDMRSRVYEECIRIENEYLTENGAVLFDGVSETLHMLKDSGYSLAVVSNCQSGYIPAFMRSMKLEDVFCDFEEWGNTLKPKSDNIRLVMKRNGFTKGIYIGDTQKDGDSARACSIPFIHAAYGFGTDPQPDGILRRFDELPDVLERLLKN